MRGFGGGLNLRDSEVPESQAIDLLNVEFDDRGAVGQRAGYAQFTDPALTNQPDSVFPHYESDGTKHLLVGNGNRLDALDTTGASVANSTAPTASPHFFARFGGPTAEVTYIANGTDQVRAYNGTAFSSPAGLSGQTGKFLAVTPTSNRLVVARETGTTAGNNPSSVNFSDAGAPETFTSTNFVDLDPGDGEAITGMVAWRDYVFVFKPSKFWVFYGESTDGTGEPVFSHKKIDTGTGLAASKAIAVATEALYFLSSDGVYRTTGPYAPELVSDIINPFFLGDAPLYYGSNTLNHGSIDECAGAFSDEKVFFACPTGVSATNDAILTYDPRINAWSLYDIEAAALTQFEISGQPELVFAAPTGDNHVYRHHSRYVNDAMSTTGTGGSAITSRWRSGWFRYGPEVDAIREAVLTGSGRVGVSYFRDRRNSGTTLQTVTFSGEADTWGDGSDASDTWGDGTDSSDLWGPTDTLTSKMVRQAVRGRTFSVRFSNSTLNQSWAVHEFVNHLRERRVPSVVGTEGS
jgi:hypothetical protein